ncbi:MAG: peptidoglycan DL-endopeptidase CwlO [Streptomyces sp.]|nr:peptidoglycan DL-endopeptidase CwlO [Streptomyces sp.]
MSVARRNRRWSRSAAVCGALLAAAALSVPAVPQQAAAARPYDPPPGPADPPVPLAVPPAVAPAPTDLPLTELLPRLKTLFLQTETATDAYNQAKQTADQQRAKAEDVDRQLADQRVAVAGARDEIGLMARRMYQDGGVSPYLSLLTGESPQDFFGERHILRRAAGHEEDVLAELTGGEARLNALNAQAQRALDAAQHAQHVQEVRKQQVESGLRQVEAALAGLSGGQIAQLQTLEQQGVDQAQQQLMDAKALGADPGNRAPSAAGDKAIGYAFRQLGKPYVSGAQGPDGFDGSGLTSQAWAHAGVAVPRTSQEQWTRLPHVPLGELRPGDLVVYFREAAHVALYIGAGQVIEAPRPGATVKVSPLAVDPVLGAVRPDPDGQPLTDYRPRVVPPQAQVPTPIGVRAPAATSTPE